MQSDYIFQYLEHEYAYHMNLYKGDIIHNELVSIIMPSYNNAEYIFRAMNSALSQQGVNIELIVVDDGSTDNSVDIAHSVAKELNNVRIIPLLRNFGCYYARNIGVSYANGDYIIIHDSDDIMHPEMILRQLNFLKKYPTKIACQCRLQKWNTALSRTLADPKYGENTLLWKKEIIHSMGWYDSVRYGGDSEFRCRLKKIFGGDAIAYLEDILYALRTRKNSLTTSQNSSAFAVDSDGGVKLQLNKSRIKYVENFSDWHDTLKEKKEYITWPLFKRPFDLYKNDQNASPALMQRKIGTMASFPPRKEVLQKTLATIVPQLDQLILYLNNYDNVPEFAIHPKIKVILGNDANGDLRDNGKFYAIDKIDNAYIFTLDDDIVYPKDYTEKLIHYIEMFNRLCVVGVHGVIFTDINFTDIRNRCVYSFTKKAHGHFVDLLGTGTTAWHSSLLNISLNDFKSKGLCDIYFAKEAMKKNIPLFSVPRTDGWLQQAQRHTEDSIYIQTIQNPSLYFNTYKENLLPFLKKHVRHRMEKQISSLYDYITLRYADLELNTTAAVPIRMPIITRRNISDLRNLHYSLDKRNNNYIHYHIILYGKNAGERVDNMVKSIGLQQLGEYTYTVTIADLGSTDGTPEKIAQASILPDMNLICFDNTTSLMHALRVSLKPVVYSQHHTIIVCINYDYLISNNLLFSITNIFTQEKKYRIILNKNMNEAPALFVFRYIDYKNFYNNRDTSIVDIIKNNFEPSQIYFYHSESRDER